MPIFNHPTKGRVLFIHIPKTAGSSINEWLRNAGYKLDKLVSWSGWDHQHAPKKIYDTWGSFDYKFAIVRHPLDRFVSALGFRTIHQKDADKIASDLIKQYKNDKLPAQWGNHLQPQIDFVDDDTQVFKFEEEFFTEISEVLDIPGPFPHINKARTGVKSSDLSETTLDAIKQLYAQDYKKFGYTP